MGQGNRPLGITILAILGFIGAVLLFIIGAIVATIASLISSALAGTIFSMLGAILSAIFIGLGIWELLFAIGLWKGWKAIWYLALIFQVFGLVGSCLAITTSYIASIPSIIFSLVIIWYLLRKNVKEYFGI